MRKLLNKTIRSGLTTGASANKLICSSGEFLSGAWPVRIGDKAVLEVDDAANTEATITALDSDSQLTLDTDIFLVSQQFRILIGDIYLTGNTTSTSSSKLVDSAKNFKTSGVRPDMLVLNTSTNYYAWVESVDETELSLSKNIFSGSAEGYEIYSGDTIFEREYDELRLRKFLIVGDDTEVTTTSTSDEKLKELLCASSEEGYLIKGLRFVYECKADGGTLTVTTKVDGSTKGTNTVSSSSYAVYTLSLDEEFADGSVIDIDIYGKVSSGTGYLRLTEIYAIVGGN